MRTCLAWIWGGALVMSLAACSGEDGAPGLRGGEGERGPNGLKGADGTKGAQGADGEGVSEDDLNAAVNEAVGDAVNDAVKDAVPGAVDENIRKRAKGCDAIEMDPADYDGVFQVGKHLESGEETEVCALYKTGPRDIWVNYSDLELAEGSHHGLLWLTTLTEMPLVDNLGEPVELGKAVPCDGTVNRFDPASHPISGSQGSGNDVSAKGMLPDNVAIKVPANSYVVADLHMINATPEPIDACMKVGLVGIDEDDVEFEAGSIFMYNIMINSPAGGTASARQACPITRDIKLKTATSHMHKTGVNYEAKLLDGNPFDSATEMKMMLYETTEWESPVATTFDEPIEIEAGSWIDYRCDYDNKTDRDIAGGTETPDEMCMFIGVAWPYDRSMAECARPGHGVNDDAGGAGYQIGDGDANGVEFLECLLGNINKPGATDFSSGHSGLPGELYENAYALQGCFVNACEPVGEFSRPYFNCLAGNVGACQEECTAAQANFQAQCALTPVADGGCREKFGTNGSDGTCATDSAVTSAAVGKCMAEARAHIIDGICTDLCGAACADPTAASCTDCKGTIDFDQANTKCLNQQTLVCVGDEVKKSATACVTACFTECITPKVTDCVISDCVNGDVCKPEFTGLVTTTCP